MSELRMGIDVLCSNLSIARHWGKCGLLANQASVTSSLEYSWDAVRRILPSQLVSLFGPQHGFYGTKQDNMIETDHSIHDSTGLPLYSLYSETREPTELMMGALDTIIVDLQIVGCRIYTWKASIAGCLRSAKKFGKKVVILDRPNPVGGETVEGRVLDLSCSSFVGEFPIPMRHGLTSGEAAQFFNSFIGADLEVVRLENWNPSHYWSNLGRQWVLTSPNLPTVDSVYVYPGTVLFEGTNISEGRGTGLPFQLIGAPYIEDQVKFCDAVREKLGGDTPGVFLRPAQFEPTSQKWAGQTCKGLQIHVLDFKKLRSFNLSLAIIRTAIEMGEGKFRWKEPPYEYDHKTLPMKLIFGDSQVDLKFFDNDFSIDDKYWNEGFSSYRNNIDKYLLYSRKLGL